MKLIKVAVLYAFTSILFWGCTSNPESTNNNEPQGKEMINEIQNHRTGTIMLIVKAKTELSDEEFLKIAKERESQFEAIPGLIQKYYIKTKTPGEFGGVYIWDSIESLKMYKESELAATIGQAYKTIGPPTTEIVDIMFELRE